MGELCGIGNTFDIWCLRWEEEYKGENSKNVTSILLGIWEMSLITFLNLRVIQKYTLRVCVDNLSLLGEWSWTKQVQPNTHWGRAYNGWLGNNS